METKVCPKCGRGLPLSDFYNDRSKKDGKESNCKECRKEHLENNKEKIKECEKEYYEKTKKKSKTIKKNTRRTEEKKMNYLQ